ncbi:O-antigen ligase family protein [Pseudonocardia sp. CA-107938]|uniref:O-antigen ligase family protein n=1 Tax=Pseudonocardia sp. CA-107938 TaxID=3240021 RepID=UPI003D8BFB14
MTGPGPRVPAHRAPRHRGVPGDVLPDAVVVAGLGGAIGYAALQQGGFYAPQLATVAALVGLAALGRACHLRRRVPSAVVVAAAAMLAFAAWVAVRAASVQVAAAPVTVAAVTALALVCAAGLPSPHRQALLAVVLAVAVIVAASCWVGVAFHVEPLALTSSGLWRGASTLTYANATAAFLVVALLVAVAALPDGTVRVAVVAVLALGLVSTMSRAGAIGLVVAAGALVLRAPHRPLRLGGLVSAVPAVAVAGAGLLPSLPVDDPPHPWLAGAGLVAGAAVLAYGRRMRPRHLLAGLLLGVAVAAAIVAFVPAARTAAAGIVETRLTLESAERADLTRVTEAQFRTAPWTGIGPGELDLRYVDHTGTRVRAFFTHDEYLQTATENGLVGLAFVGTAMVALAVAGLRARSVAGAAATAAVAGFAAHSAFDFLWHIPVLPLQLAVTTAVLLTHAPLRSERVLHSDGALRSNREDVP